MKEWKSKVFEAAVVLVAIALASHIVWALLQPLVPVLIVLVALVVIYGTIFHRRR